MSHRAESRDEDPGSRRRLRPRRPGAGVRHRVGHATRGELHVVHITDHEGESTERLVERAKAVLDEAGLSDEPGIVTDTRMSRPKYAARVGKDILRIADEGSYDHVVVGHQGSGAVGRPLLGSAAETVVRIAWCRRR